jgi:hypothetical protein
MDLSNPPARAESFKASDTRDLFNFSMAVAEVYSMVCRKKERVLSA